MTKTMREKCRKKEKEENVKREEKTREMEERTFECTQKVMRLNSVYMFHMGPMGNFPNN